MSTSRVINKLTQVKFFQLTEMLRNEQEWLKTNNPTYVEAAKYMGEKLGFTVTDSQISTAAKLTGVKWENPILAAKQRGKSNKNKIEELEKINLRLLEDNQKLHSRLDVQQGLIHYLYEQLDAKYPVGYTAPAVGKQQNVSALLNTKR